ncbi:MAG: signal peptidase II [Myxococcales bacterium]|jgi:signal peptidase II
MTERRSSRAIAFCLAALAALTVADLWTKAWAVDALSRERASAPPGACTPDQHGRYYMQRLRSDTVVLVDGYLELRYAENCGAAFGMLDEAPKWVRVSVFMTAGALAVGALMWMFVVGNGGVLFAWSVPLIVSGAVGNMVDRIRLGYVVDFIRFHLHDTWEWPTFNVADSTITVGVALLLLDGMRRQEQPARQPTTSPGEGVGGEGRDEAREEPRPEPT